MTRNPLQPALLLAGISPVLTELITGNIPANVFFMPWVFAFLLVVYGLPALLVRELFIRWGLGLPGLFLLGLAYGIFNEGVCAKTLLLNADVPISAFDGYAWHGINVAWAAVIVPWHALHAIIFPIALVTWRYPDEARASWLSTRFCVVAALFLFLFGAVVHLGNKEHVTKAIYFYAFLMAMGGLVWLAHGTAKGGGFLQAGGRAPRWLAAAGFVFYPVFVLGASACAGMKLPTLVVCLLAAVVLVGTYRLLAAKGALALRPFLLFALGDYLFCALFMGAVGLARGGVLVVVTALVLAAIFAWLMTKINDWDFSSPVAKSGLN